MLYSRLLALAALAAGIVMSSGAARAGDYYSDTYRDRQDLRRDYSRTARLREDIAADRYRLERDLRRGNRYAAEKEARDIARDERALDRQLRDIRHDRRDLYWDRR